MDLRARQGTESTNKVVQHSPNPKKPMTGRHGPTVWQFTVQSIGAALFGACPYMYHALMIHLAGTRYEVPALILTPLVVMLVAYRLLWIGGKKHAK